MIQRHNIDLKGGSDGPVPQAEEPCDPARRGPRPQGPRQAEDAKLAAKNEAKRIRSAERSESKAIRAQVKTQRNVDRTAVKVAQTELRTAREGKLLSPGRVRRTLAVSRLLAPVLVPMIYRAATSAAGHSTNCAPTASGFR